MKLGHIERFVRDVVAAREFYIGALGFKDAVPMQGGVAWISLGETELLLRPGTSPPTGSSYGVGGHALVLYTDDLAATRAALEAHGVTMDGTDGSPKCLTFRDPDGYWFQLVNPNDM